MKYLLTAGKFCKKREKEDKKLSFEFNNRLEHFRAKNAANTVLSLKKHLDTKLFNQTGIMPNYDETLKGAVEIFIKIQNSPLLDSMYALTN